MGRALFGERRVARPPAPFGPFTPNTVRRMAPKVAIFEYLELWPAWTRACHRAGIPMVIVDGRITRKSLRIAPYLRPSAARLAAFCAQTETDAHHARHLGVVPSRIHTMGNAKFDGFALGPPRPSSELLSAVGERDVVVGSLHPDEEADFVKACVRSQMRVLVAPRYMRRVAKLMRGLAASGVSVGLRSHGASSTQIAILDSIGELAAAYALAPTAIIGGTFGKRHGQNLFEAAVHERHIIFGPNHKNVALEVSTLRGHGIHEVDCWTRAFALAAQCCERPQPSTQKALAQLKGASIRQGQLIEALIDKTPFQVMARIAAITRAGLQAARTGRVHPPWQQVRQSEVSSTMRRQGHLKE